MTAWRDNDALFRSELEGGKRVEHLVAERLRGMGIKARETPLEWRANITEAKGFATETDIWVGDFPIEVKSRRLRFSNDPQSYPYQTAFVDTVSGWEQKNPTPRAVVLVSRQSGGLLVVSPRHSLGRWTKTTRKDNVRGITDTWYLVAKDDLLPMAHLERWLTK